MSNLKKEFKLEYSKESFFLGKSIPAYWRLHVNSIFAFQDKAIVKSTKKGKVVMKYAKEKPTKKEIISMLTKYLEDNL